MPLPFVEDRGVSARDDSGDVLPVAGEEPLAQVQVPRPPLHLDGVGSDQRVGEDFAELEFRLQYVRSPDDALEIIEDPPVVSNHGE